MKSIGDFIRENASPLAAKVRERMKPLHDPEVDAVHPSIKWLLRKPKGPQGHLITGAVKALARQKDIVWGNSPGTGKTFCSIATAHAVADNKPYACLVVCPPHLVNKWEREIRATIKGVVVIQVDDWRQWMMLAKADKSLVKKPTYFVTPISKSKLGAAWRAAALKNKCSGLLCCPKCASVIYEKKDKPAKWEWIQRSKRFCDKCGDALWQYYGTEKIAPSKVARRWMKGWFDTVILDEAHQLRGDDTLAGEAFHDFVSVAKKVQLLTGTLIAGKSDDLRATYFRLLPSRFLKRGFKWVDKGAFSERYGKIEEIIVAKQKHGSKEYSQAKVTKKIKPGIMPYLYGDFVADRTLFLSLKDMGEELPPYTDSTTPIAMPKEMAIEYENMSKVLIDKFQELVQSESPLLGLRFLSTIAEALLTWPDDPSGWGEICYKDEDKVLVPVYRPKLINSGLLPKEEALLKVLEENADAGRQSWVFSTRHETTARILNIINRRFDVGHLAVKVPTHKREAWIAKEGPRVEVMVSHPKLVETGVELFGEGFNFSNIIWYATGLELNVVRQASARAWRIGQTLPCDTRYLYYQKTAQENVIKHMAKKLVGAEFLEGSLEGGGLMSEADDIGIEMAIIKQLSESIRKERAA